MCLGDSRTLFFSVADTDFEGGDDDHGYGDFIFLVIYVQSSHRKEYHHFLAIHTLEPVNTLIPG